MIQRSKFRLAVALLCASAFALKPVDAQQAVSLFDGKTFSGWEGDTDKTWRIEDGVIIAGAMETPAPRNEFLCTKAKYSDFELTLEFKLVASKKINAGVQFRTELPGDHSNESQVQEYNHVVGYQADIGTGYHGCLYDEARRRKVLARPDAKTDKEVETATPDDGWQSYRIRAVGNRIQLWLNGVQTVDYMEDDKSIATDGMIALQIHGNMVGTIAYRNISINDLSKQAAKVSIDDISWISGHWTGDALGGQFEETWNPPMGGEMLGMFKLVQGGKVAFYELLTIVPSGDSYVLRLKHFSKGLVGWEEKDKSVEFPLISASPTAIEFNGLKFTRDSKFTKDVMKIEVITEQDGKRNTLVFHCNRAKSK